MVVVALVLRRATFEGDSSSPFEDDVLDRVRFVDTNFFVAVARPAEEVVVFAFFIGTVNLESIPDNSS